MLLRIRNLYQKIRRILADFDRTVKRTGALERRIADLENELRKRTDLAVDIGYRRENYIIAVGRLGNTDYVQTFCINEDFNGLIAHLKDMEKYATLRRVDAPPVFRAVFDKRSFQ